MENHGSNSQEVGPVALPAAAATAPPARHRRLRVWALVLAVFAGLFTAISRHRTEAAAAASLRGVTGPTPLTTAIAKSDDLQIYLEAIGTVTPVYTHTITAQVPGVITGGSPVRPTASISKAFPDDCAPALRHSAIIFPSCTNGGCNQHGIGEGILG